MRVVVAAFNKEKALVGAFSVITNLRMELFEALMIYPLAPTYVDITLFSMEERHNENNFLLFGILKAMIG